MTAHLTFSKRRGKEGGGAGETIHCYIMSTADPWFSWRDLSNIKKIMV